WGAARGGASWAPDGPPERRTFSARRHQRLAGPSGSAGAQRAASSRPVVAPVSFPSPLPSASPRLAVALPRGRWPESTGTRATRTRKNRARCETLETLSSSRADTPHARERLRKVITLLREHSRVALARGLGYCADALGLRAHFVHA